jgi:hypothetical protein
MDSILEPDLTWYAREKGRIWSYWGVNDGWVGERSEELKMVLGGDHLDGGGVDGHVVEDADERGIDGVASDQGQVVDCVDNVPHAFCLGKSRSLAVEGRTLCASVDGPGIGDNSSFGRHR